MGDKTDILSLVPCDHSRSNQPEAQQTTRSSTKPDHTSSRKYKAPEKERKSAEEWAQQREKGYQLSEKENIYIFYYFIIKEASHLTKVQCLSRLAIREDVVVVNGVEDDVGR